MVRDISAQEALEAELRQAQKLESVGQLAAGIAHEINTPAQYVSDNISFVSDVWEEVLGLTRSLIKDREEQGIDTEQLDFPFIEQEVPLALNQCSEGLTHISRIVQAMKNFSHPGESDKAPSNINQLIDNVIVISTSEWKYVAEIQRDYEPELEIISCESSSSNQVFLNLIVNAAHAIDEKFGETQVQGLIRITTKNSDDGTEILIQDNGIGMSADVKQKIYNPFFTTKEVGKGSGQGLAISYATIVENHGGSIDVESTIGEVSVFIIRLPRQIENEPAASLGSH
ncbi:MAG: two-component system NtrC family sensor kinase [Candidatus Azotimanducaceae bacterium]|jgi:two-component system NtrC family sensor kinase